MPEILFHTGDKIAGGAGRLPPGWQRIDAQISYYPRDARRGLVYYVHNIEAPGFRKVWISVRPTDDLTGWQWTTRATREKFGPREILCQGGPFARAVEAMTDGDAHEAARQGEL